MSYLQGQQIPARARPQLHTAEANETDRTFRNGFKELGRHSKGGNDGTYLNEAWHYQRNEWK